MRRRAVSPAVWALARGLLRRRRWASVAVVLFAGLAAAVPMTVWAAGRYTATTLDRSLERAGAADVFVTVCPPGFDPTTQSDPVACLEYQPDHELAAIRSLPGVAESARAGVTMLRMGATPDPERWWPTPVIHLSDRAGFPTVFGEPEVVSGRMAAADAPDEVMMNEASARALGIRPGHRVWMQGGGEGSAESGAPVNQSRVVGVVRTVADLLPLNAGSLGVPPIHARDGWSRSHARELSPAQTLVVVWLNDGDVEGFETRLQARLGNQAIAVSPALDQADRSNIQQATAFESRAALAAAAVAAVAAAFFISQGVSRQSRAESSDVTTLVALGMTRRQLAATGTARWLPTALGGAAVAVAATVGASLFGPIGLARRGSWEPGVRADWVVLLGGGVTVAALVLASGAVTLCRRREQGAATAGSVGTHVALGSPGVRAGVAMARRSLARANALPAVSALVGTALAVAVVIAADGGAASLRRVVDSPERFGAPWDALIEGDPVPERQGEILATLTRVPGIAGAATIPGNTVTAGDEELWIQAIVPVEGTAPIRPVITAGRAPITDDEIALGSVTMRRLGLDVGDEVPMRSQLLGTEVRPYRVVGVTMVSDGYEPQVGQGGLVSFPGLLRVAPESDVETNVGVVVRVVSGPGRVAALAALGEAFPTAFIPPPLPSSLANAERIAGLPLFLGIAAGPVAAVTLTHALVVSVRRNRRELAVYRVLGFTRAQVYGAVATQATLIGVGAAAVGGLFGVLGARWGWWALADSLGVASGPIVPVGVAVLSVVVALLVANLAAAAAGFRATRLRTADVLRAE